MNRRTDRHRLSLPAAPLVVERRPAAAAGGARAPRPLPWLAVLATFAAGILALHGRGFGAHPHAIGPAAPVTAPTPSVASPTAPPRLPTGPAQAQAAAILENAGGDGALVIQRPGQPPLASVNADQPLPSASLYKLGVMAAVFQAADRGTISLDRPLTITQDEVDFYGDAPATPAGVTISVREALTRMITVSDNSAAGALIDLVGARAVNAAFAANGMPGSRLGSGPGAQPRTIAQTTAADQAAFFQRLLDGKVVSRAASRDMLALLEAQQENDRLPAGLPPGARVAHKTGELDGVRNDAGIIFTPAGPIICAVLISDQPEAGLAVEAIAELGRLAYQLALAGPPPPP